MRTLIIALATGLLASGASAAGNPKKQRPIFVSGVLCSNTESLKRLVMNRRNDIGVSDAAMKDINRSSKTCEAVQGTYVFLGTVGEFPRSDGRVFGIITVKDRKTGKKFYRAGFLPGWGI